MPSPDAVRLTVLGTTDTHGFILNWDYFTDAEYDDAQHNDVGLAKLATLIASVRASRGATLTLDAGDTIQGTPLAYQFSKLTPNGPVHPMAAAMNAIGYDAAAVGNHEFNYGLETLRAFQSQLQHPLLCANAFDWETGAPAFDPWVMVDVPVGGQAGHVRVGVIGLVTPGCAIWDKAHLDGRVRFTGIVEQASVVVPAVLAAGAEVVIVACHSGAGSSSSYGDALPWPENAATALAEQVPGIDAILVGHAHVEIAERFVTGPDGRAVLLSEPLKWGQRLTVMDLDLVSVDGRWRVESSASTVLNTNTVAADPVVVELVTEQHEAVRAYVNSVIGTSTAAMSALASRYSDTAVLRFLNQVQASAVRAGLADPSLPVLAASAPFRAGAGIPSGAVTVRDLAGLYPFDNTLLGVVLTGAQVREYLEFSAGYFKQVTGVGPFTPRQLTRAVTPTSPFGTPDYNYDVLAGLDADLTYDIDVSRAAGSRIAGLSYAGVPVAAEQQFVLAVNNYRASGGGGFPAVSAAPVVYDAQVEIRQLIIDWVTAAGTIDPARFTGTSWQLVSDGRPVLVTP